MDMRALGSRILPHRLILAVLLFGLILGTREYLGSRDRGPVEWLTDEGRRVMEVITSVNPSDPDSDFFAAMEALAEGDEATFARRLEQALASGAKHNELMERVYVQYLLATSSDAVRINEGFTRWRRNHPFAGGALALELGRPPETVQELETLEARLGAIDWVAKVTPEGWETEEGIHWRILLEFRRGRRIDVREALAAAYAVLPSEIAHTLGLETGAAVVGRSPGSGWHPW